MKNWFINEVFAKQIAQELIETYEYYETVCRGFIEEAVVQCFENDECNFDSTLEQFHKTIMENYI